MTSRFTYTPLGDQAVLITLKSGSSEGRELVSAGALAEKFRTFNLRGVTDIVPAFSQLAIHYNPHEWISSSASAQSPFERIVEYLERKLVDEEIVLSAKKSQLVRIPVCYDKKMGLDLVALSLTLGVSVDDVINLHQSVVYSVGAIGFAPGFAYLEGLDSVLKIPRRDAPRTRVPAGSVAIGGAYSGIYPSTLPGGWHTLGRTRMNLFRKKGDCGALLRVGDQVQFEVISIEEYDVNQSRETDA